MQPISECLSRKIQENKTFYELRTRIQWTLFALERIHNSQTADLVRKQKTNVCN